MTASAPPRWMHALTIWQPWATLIVAGAKPYEFRGYAAPATFVGGRIVIHAGKRSMREAELVDLLNRLDDLDDSWSTGLDPAIARPLLTEALYNPAAFALGAGLGSARLGTPVPANTLALVDSDRVDDSKWAWPLTAIEPFDEPIPCNGAQGFWRWHDAASLARRAA